MRHRVSSTRYRGIHAQLNILDRAGQVSKGALSLLSELPVKMITKEELPNLVMDPSECLHRSW
jgi:hypothetical protein